MQAMKHKYSFFLLPFLAVTLALCFSPSARAADTLIVNMAAEEEADGKQEIHEEDLARERLDELVDEIIESNATKPSVPDQPKASPLQPKPEPKPEQAPKPAPKEPDPFKARTVGSSSPAAYVQAVEGDAWAFHDFSAYRPLELKSPVYPGESVETSPLGAVRIMFLDGSVLEIKEGSHVDIENFAYDPSRPDKGVLALKLAKGAFRIVAGKLARANPNGFTVQGPVSTLMATEAEIGSQITEEQDLHALINGLPIIVRNRSGSVRSVDMQDYALSVRRGLKTLTAPVMLTNAQKGLLYKRRFTNEVGAEQMRDVLSGRNKARQEAAAQAKEVEPKKAEPTAKATKKAVKGGPARLDAMPKVKSQPAPRKRKRLQDMTPAERERFLNKGAGQ